jgi:hypothetical protein
MRDDTRLRWVSLLVVQWEEVWPAGSAEPSADSLLSAINGLIEPDRVLLERARETSSFDTRLEVYGPARLLKALGASPRPLRVTVQNPRVLVSIDLENGLLVGAEASLFEPEPATLHGLAAVAALSVLSSGRVTIESIEHAMVANVMDPIEIAVSQAFSEEPPIPASRPSASFLGSIEAALSLAPPPPSPPPLLETTPIAMGAMDSPEVAPHSGRRTRLLVAGVLVALVAFFAIALAMPPLRSRTSAAPVQPASPASPASAPAPVEPRSLIERARAGEVDAMKEIELRPQEERTVDGNHWHAAGRRTKGREPMACAAIRRDPKLADRPETLRTP